jgi:uncharacterized protein (TIGR03435 family)
MLLQNDHTSRRNGERSRCRNPKGQALYLGVLMVAAVGASSQTAMPDRLAFEVASVKPSQSAGGRFTMSGGPGTSDPGRVSYSNVPLRRVLLAAYDLSNYQILGPDWLNSLRFDITAKMPAGVTKEQFQWMLRNLVASRFRMTTHLETKELPIYALVAAKSGPKLKPDVDGEPGKSPDDQVPAVTQGEGKDGFPVVSLRTPGLVIETKDGRARVTAKGVTIAKFADFLSGRLDRPVIDMTGLAATYSFALYFSPENASPDASSDPSIFIAVQEQLGLRLEARKGQVQLLMIDHAEKAPTEN